MQLKKFPPTQSLPHLSDFAKLEWLKHKAYVAEDKAPLSAYDFRDIDIKKYGKFILKFHPSAFLFSSSYPLDQILDVVEEKVESIELTKRKSYALVLRPSSYVQVH